MEYVQEVAFSQLKDKANTTGDFGNSIAKLEASVKILENTNINYSRPLFPLLTNLLSLDLLSVLENSLSPC